MAVMNWLPRGSSGGDTGNKMNIFVQPTEPYIKEGIWIDENGSFTDIHITEPITDDYDYTKMLDIPYEFYNGSTSVVGTDIYLFGSSGTRTNCYKYDTISNTYTKMLDIPYEFNMGSTSVVGTDIYVFGDATTRTNCYKYDTISNTYTKMLDIPYAFYLGSTSVAGTDIYLFGSGYAVDIQKYCYKYNTLSNTYTRMLDIPYQFYQGSTPVVGNDVYLFGSGGSGGTNCYKYDTISNTYTKMLDIPYAFYLGSTSVIGTDVYLFGSSATGAQTNCYKYNTLSNTYTKMLDIPYGFHNGSTSVVGTNVYLFGGYAIKKYCYKFHKVTPSFDNDTFIIIKTSEHDGLYQTQFFQPPEDINPDYMDRIVSGFDDALLYADDTMQDSLPTYYGNGTEWIKFKN